MIQQQPLDFGWSEEGGEVFVADSLSINTGKLRLRH